MNEFTKQKIAFAVGLLAVLFTITPLLEPFGAIGYTLFEIQLTFRRLYYLLTIILALAVYAYAVQFLTERDLRYPSRVGDALYAVAIVTPAFYFMLFGLFRIAEALTPILNGAAIRRLQDVLGVLTGVLTWLALNWLVRAIARRTDRAFASQLRDEEVEHARLAAEHFAAGHFNPAVLEIWKAVEAAAGRFLLDQRSRAPFWRRSVWQRIRYGGAIAFEQVEAFTALRRLRNSAGNTTAPISREQAEKAMSIGKQILQAFAEPPSKADTDSLLPPA